jgi:hypothetical protein
LAARITLTRSRRLFPSAAIDESSCASGFSGEPIS